MSEQLRVGVIGAGNMGQHHIRNYAEIPEVSLVAYSDPDPEQSRFSEEYDIEYYANYQEMLGRVSLDAVSVVVPTPLHHKIAGDTLDQGLHTLLEKPIASTAAEAKELILKAQQQGLVLTVGHIERYNPVVCALKAIIDQGRLGDISSIVSQRVGGFPLKEPKTDVIMDLAIHDIDILSFLTGRQGELIGVHGSRTYHSSEVDSAEILMKHNGTSGFIQANWVTPVKMRRILITGSKGFVEADYITQQAKFYEADESSFRDFRSRFSGITEGVDLDISAEEPLRRELNAFILAASGVLPTTFVSPEEALDALNVSLEISQKLARDLGQGERSKSEK